MTKYDLDRLIEANIADFTDTYFWGKFPRNRF